MQLLRLREYPLAQVVAAEDADGVDAAEVLADKAAFGDKAVRARTDGPTFKAVFKGLDVGLYGVFVNARAEAGQIEPVRRLAWFDLKIDSGPLSGASRTRVKKGPSFFTPQQRQSLWDRVAAGQPAYKLTLTHFDKSADIRTPAGGRCLRRRRRRWPPAHLPVRLRPGRYRPHPDAGSPPKG